MKKFIFIFAALFTMLTTSNAQIAIETPKFLDNTYMGLGVGVSSPLTFNSVFPLNTSFNLKAGKDFSPVFGAQIEGSFIMGDNWGYHHTSCLSNTFFRGTNVALLGTVNISNLLAGYKGVPRTFELSTIAGLGWGHVLNHSYIIPATPREDGNGYYNAIYVRRTHRDDLTAKTGFNLGFNLGQTKAWQIYVEPAVLWNLTGKETVVQFDKRLAQLSLSAGIVYKFKTSNGTHNFKTWDVGSLLDQIQSLLAENEDLRNRQPTIIEKRSETIIPQDNEIVVPFELNSDVLTEAGKALLNRVPEGSTVKIIGAASPEGSAKRNSELSRNRAQAVADYLIHERDCTVEDVRGDEAGRMAVVTILR